MKIWLTQPVQLELELGLGWARQKYSWTNPRVIVTLRPTPYSKGPVPSSEAGSCGVCFILIARTKKHSLFIISFKINEGRFKNMILCVRKVDTFWQPWQKLVSFWARKLTENASFKPLSCQKEINVSVSDLRTEIRFNLKFSFYFHVWLWKSIVLIFQFQEINMI